jgi:hypothetical protein
MKKDYIIKPFKKHEDLAELDNKKRTKVENIIGKKLTDSAWFDYKKMVMDRNKR